MSFTHQSKRLLSSSSMARMPRLYEKIMTPPSLLNRLTPATVERIENASASKPQSRTRSLLTEQRRQTRLRKRYGQFYDRFVAAGQLDRVRQQQHVAFEHAQYHQTFPVNLTQTDGSTVTYQSCLKIGIKAGTPIIKQTDIMGKIEAVKDTISHPLWNDVVGGKDDMVDAANESFARFRSKYESAAGVADLTADDSEKELEVSQDDDKRKIKRESVQDVLASLSVDESLNSLFEVQQKKITTSSQQKGKRRK
ncbi:hypothetical protein MP228_012474 [Amoeboaphelidium protococcarum]|nr:hypothetical protein MP228_012474 [Amoeboaphelidium protococcarum]